MIGQFIIVLYLIDRDSSLLMTVPSAIGVMIALWKCQRAAGFSFVPLSAEDRKSFPSFWNMIPRIFGYKLTAKRLQITVEVESEDNQKANAGNSSSKRDLQALTIEADRQATSRLGSVLLPLVSCVHDLLTRDGRAHIVVFMAHHVCLFRCVRLWICSDDPSTFSQLQAQERSSPPLEGVGV